jgi:hypothetical protein
VARAVEWDEAKPARPEGRLLRSGEIAAVQTWASGRLESGQIPDVVFQFVDASLKKEEHDRQELISREQRISERTQRLVATEARRAREALQHSSAMRLALAAEPSEEERNRGILQDPARHAELAAAAQASLSVGVLLGHSGLITCADFSPDGIHVVTALDDHTARLWDARTGTELIRMKHEGRVTAAVFSNGGARVATACRNIARVWDATDGTEISRLVHEKPVNGITFSSDGARLVTTSGSTARVWNTVKGVELCSAADNGEVSSAVLSPDGANLITACGHSTRVWDAASGAELVRVAHKDKVNGVAVSSDGARLLTASDDYTARGVGAQERYGALQARSWSVREPRQLQS